jgi:hypothetical protein
MHINLRQHNDAYSAAELVHIQQCNQCQEDLSTFKKLQAAAKKMPEIVPEVLNWQAIKQRTINIEQTAIKAKPKLNRTYLFQQFIRVAASTFFIAVGWLVWNNHQLQNQLEQMLVINSVLEEQVITQIEVSFQQVALIETLRDIDSELLQAQTKIEKVAVLQKRQVILKNHINTLKGSSHVFSI